MSDAGERRSGETLQGDPEEDEGVASGEEVSLRHGEFGLSSTVAQRFAASHRADQPGLTRSRWYSPSHRP